MKSVSSLRLWLLETKFAPSFSPLTYMEPRAIIGQRGTLPVRPLGYLNFKKAIFRTMRTMRKQFPVKQYTSGRLAFIQKKCRPKWSNVTWLNYPASAKNIIAKANGKNVYLIGSFKISGKIQLKPPRETFLLELKIGEQDWLSRGGRSSKTRGFHTFLISFNSSIWMADMPQEQDKTSTQTGL